MNVFKIASSLFLIILFSTLVFAATGSCTVNGQPVECPQIWNDYGVVIVIGFFIIGILLIIFFVIVPILKARAIGSLTFSMPKLTYTQGEIITGTMNLVLKKPIEVSLATVEIRGERTTGHGKNQRTDMFYQTDAKIITPPTYSIGNYQEQFSIQIPSDILSKGKVDASALGVIGDAFNMIQTMSAPRPRWYVLVGVTTKENINLTEEIEIQIN